MTRDVDIRSSVDRAGRRFLAAVEYYGGEATTTEIRRRTGLSRSEANHRFSTLDDLGLIDISYADVGRGDREPPKVATLTGKARMEIERGLLYDIDRDRDHEDINDLASEIRALRETIERVETKVDVAVDSLRSLESQVDDIDEDVDWLLDDIDDLEAALRGLRDAAEAAGIEADDAIRAQLEQSQ